MPKPEDRKRVPPVNPGDWVRHFEILSELGRGGMGIVYRARDTELGDRHVALKCLWPDLASDPAYRRRFVREAKASSRLSHPNIVPVHAAFEEKGTQWLVLQLVEGSSLRVLLRTKGRFPVRDVLTHGVSLAQALHAAHDQRVLHRDITTNNVLVTRDGRALLSDFGLAKFFPREGGGSPTDSTISVLTDDRALIGTLRFMSPEAVVGDPVDTRSDIFSLGVVLYEMCTGNRAFSASHTGRLIESIRREEPEPVSKFAKEAPEELQRVIRKAMAKSADERYQTSAELAEDLLRAKNRHEIASGGWNLRRVFLAAAAVLAILAVWFAYANRARLTDIMSGLFDSGPASLGKPVQVTSTEAWEGEPALSPDGRRVAYAAEFGGNLDIFVVDAGGGTPLRLTDEPSVDTSPSWFPDGSAIAFASDRSGRNAIWKVGQLGGGATLLLVDAASPAISPDGEWIAFCRGDEAPEQRIWIAPLNDVSSARRLTTAEDGIWDHFDPEWSPDGRWICYSTRRRLWKVAVDGGRAVPVTEEDAYGDIQPTWSRSDLIYFASRREGTTAVWRVRPDGRLTERLTMGSGPEIHPTVSRDGLRLAYSTELLDHDLVILNTATGTVWPMTDDRDEYMGALAPDGSRLVFVSDRWGSPSDLCVQTLVDGAPEGEPRRLSEQEGDVSHPAYSPDGRWIAYYRILADQRDIYVIGAEGGDPVRFTEDPSNDIQPAWSPDGSAIAFASERGGQSQVWIAPVRAGNRSGASRVVTGDKIMALAPSWSPDGRWIAFVGSEGGDFDVWVVPADGSEPARRVTSGAKAARVRWRRETGDLLVSGSWNEQKTSLRVVPVDGHPSRPFETPVVFGRAGAVAIFDVTPGERVLVFSKQRLRGNIWVIQPERGVF